MTGITSGAGTVYPSGCSIFTFFTHYSTTRGHNVFKQSVRIINFDDLTGPKIHHYSLKT